MGSAIQLLIGLGAGLLVGALMTHSLRLRQMGRLQLQLRQAANQRNQHGQKFLALQQSLQTQIQARRQQQLEAEVRNGELRHYQQTIARRDARLAERDQVLTELSERHQTLLRNYTRGQAQTEERELQHARQLKLLNENKSQLKQEFENLANKIFEDKGRSFNSTSQASLETLLQPFREQITNFQQRVNEVHSESLRGQTNLANELQKVLAVGLEMNDQASNLARALKGDNKTSGNWGEAQLERTLELAGLHRGDHYEAQSGFRDAQGRRKLPDFLIKLPQKKHLVIDSKVSLVAYDRAIAAPNEEQHELALGAHGLAVRRHIDDLASKHYADLPDIDSPDFVLMFMPIEPAYIEAMKYNRDLFNYGYQKGVIMVSHTTLMPILRTVANLWMVERSNHDAKLISKQASVIYQQVCLVAERLHKLGGTLRAATNHYNDTVKGLAGKQGLHGKVERFAQLSVKSNKSLAKLEPIHNDIDNERLLQQADSPKIPDQKL